MATSMEELLKMRAPNQSGIDNKAIIQALAGNPQVATTPPTYAYGMNVSDAQREAALGHQAQQTKLSEIQNLRKDAMGQDALLFDMAMKAHGQVLAEKAQELQERVAAAEIAYKNVKMQGIPAALEAQRLTNEKLRLDLDREKQMDSLTVDVPDPANPGQFRKMPVRAFMGAGGKNILSYMTGGTLNETATERGIRKKAEIYASKGIPQNDAYLLAASKPELTFQHMSKAIDTAVKNSKPTHGLPNYGTKGTTPDGKAIPKTADDYRIELYNHYVDTYFPMLSEEARAKLKAWGPGALGLLDNAPTLAPTQDNTLSQESLDAITQQLIDAYK